MGDAAGEVARHNSLNDMDGDGDDIDPS